MCFCFKGIFLNRYCRFMNIWPLANNTLSHAWGSWSNTRLLCAVTARKLWTAAKAPQMLLLWVTNQFQWAGEFANIGPWTTRSHYMKKKVNTFPAFLDQLCLGAIGWWEKGLLQQSSRQKIQGKCQNVTFVALLKWCTWTVIIKWLLNKTLSFGWWLFNLIMSKSGYLHRNQPINFYGTKR